MRGHCADSFLLAKSRVVDYNANFSYCQDGFLTVANLHILSLVDILLDLRSNFLKVKFP